MRRFAPALILTLAFAGCGEDAPSDPRLRAIVEASSGLDADAGPDRRRSAASLEKLLGPASAAQGVEAKALARLRAVAADDRDDNVQAAAVRALGAARDAASWDVIVGKAAATEPVLRMEALLALAAIDAGRAEALLAAGLADADRSVAQAAAGALAATRSGVARLAAVHASGGPQAAVALAGLQVSRLPEAAEALLAGFTSADPAQRLAAVQAAATLRHAPSLPAILAIAAQADQRRDAPPPELLRAAGEAMSAIGSQEALLALLRLGAGKERGWAEELAAARLDAIRPLILAQAALPEGQRALPTALVVRWLLRLGPEAAPVLASLATPELPGIAEVCNLMSGADPALRAKVAERLRAALPAAGARQDELLVALAHVGQPGTGPDAEAALAALKAEASVAARPRELLAAADAAAHLRVAAAAPLFRELLGRKDLASMVAGLRGAIALADPEGLALVNQLLLSPREGVNSWQFGTQVVGALGRCRDPRILPGLERSLEVYARMPDILGGVYAAIGANGSPEAAALLLRRLQDPSTSMETRKAMIAPALIAMGEAARPLLLATMLGAAPPEKRGDPDPGWWCAEFLRDQSGSSAAVLAALAEKRPTGHVAARCILALEASAEPQAIAAIAGFLADRDRGLADLALSALVRRQRRSALPEIRAARAAAGEAAWAARLDQAIRILGAPQ